MATELARQLRKSLGNNHTYLVAITGYGQPSDVEAAFEAGFDNHLVKPLNPQKLSRILQFHGRKDEEPAGDTAVERDAAAAKLTTS